MPLVEDDQLTEEQRRQALLEDLYGEESRLPQSAIPADNVSFTNGADGRIQVDVPEGYAPSVERPMIGDEQYQNELARAQRGNGFIAAEVSNNGELLQPGIDPQARTPEQLIIEEKIATAAKRFKGQQMFASIIKGGGTPQEAIRLAGADMFPDNPSAHVSAVLHSQPKIAIAKQPPLPKFRGGSVPVDVALQVKQLTEDASREKRLLEKGHQEIWDEKKGKAVRVPLTRLEKAQAEARIAEKEKQAREILAPGGQLRPEYNRNVDQAGWQRIEPAFNRPTLTDSAPPAPAAQQPANVFTNPNGPIQVEKQVAKADTKEVEARAVRDQFRSGKLSRAEAEKMLKQLGYE